jgi:hypothetical protein
MKRWKNRPEGSNWGDFGEDDQLGKMNLITPEIRRAAVKEITEGLSFCLSLPLDYPGGDELFRTRRAPHRFCIHRPTGQLNYNFAWNQQTNQPDHIDVTSDDAVTLFTQYSTQWDALGHYGQLFDADGDGGAETVYYNGYRAGDYIVSPAGEDDEPRADALGIENLAVTGVQTRGVLVSLFREYGNEHVAVDYDGLMRAMERQKAEVRRGDILCLHTGFDELLLGMNKKPDPKVLHSSSAGLDGGDDRLLNWITDSDIVAIAADNSAVEALPQKRKRQGPRALMPLHGHCLFKQGIYLGELWYFAELSKWLHAHDRNSFFLTAPPLRLPGHVGSPLTPVATV